MADSLGGAIRAFDNNANPPAPQLLTVNLANSPGGIMPAVPGANYIRIWVDISGTACTGLDLQLTPAKRFDDSITNHEPSPAIASVAGSPETIVLEGDMIVRRDFFSGPLTGKSIPIEINITPDTAYIVAMRRRGGDATTAALATAEFYSV